MEKTIYTLDDFYTEMSVLRQTSPEDLIPPGIEKEVGHFNLFNMEDLVASYTNKTQEMLHDRRTFYKISLVKGKHEVGYADKVIHVEKAGLLFATPNIPYHHALLDGDHQAEFCVFTTDFLLPAKSGLVLDELPLFRPGGCPVFEITDEQAADLALIYWKMKLELTGSYLYKFDLIRNYLIELLHYGQKLQPPATLVVTHHAAARITTLFLELLERQFPITTPHQRVALRSTQDYAHRLALHSNHLNKALKEVTGKTTKEHIGSRLMQEAKFLLRQTDWSIAEIGYSLGFEYPSHFSGFYKKHTKYAPSEFRR